MNKTTSLLNDPQPPLLLLRKKDSFYKNIILNENLWLLLFDNGTL